MEVIDDDARKALKAAVKQAKKTHAKAAKARRQAKQQLAQAEASLDVVVQAGAIRQRVLKARDKAYAKSNQPAGASLADRLDAEQLEYRHQRYESLWYDEPGAES